MKPQEFAAAWTVDGDELAVFDAAAVDALDVTHETKEFLRVGLPSDAAPFLCFGPRSGARLQSASEEFELADTFSRYRIIGFNNYGDPICVDEGDGSIIYLNHDDEFGWIYMNRSVAQLAESLVVFRDYVCQVNAAQPAQRSEVVAATIAHMAEIDPSGIEEGQWRTEVEEFAEELMA